jgi:uncharacterized protein (TIGR02594 family)
VNEPAWLFLARSYLGTTEIPGAKHNSTIVQWWKDIRSAIRDDETPYCAAFVGAMLERSNIRSTRSAAARSYLAWGVPVSVPVLGCIVVYSRPGCAWCGHVGFVVGLDSHGNIMTLGANQKNTVCIKAFAPERVLGYFLPLEAPLAARVPLPVLASNGQISVQEA